MSNQMVMVLGAKLRNVRSRIGVVVYKNRRERLTVRDEFVLAMIEHRVEYNLQILLLAMFLGAPPAGDARQRAKVIWVEAIARIRAIMIV